MARVVFGALRCLLEQGRLQLHAEGIDVITTITTQGVEGQHGRGSGDRSTCDYDSLQDAGNPGKDLLALRQVFGRNTDHAI